MLCPDCRISLLDGRCPNCGYVFEPKAPAVEESRDSSIRLPITFDIETLRQEGEDLSGLSPSDWRKELRRRVDEHSAKKGEPRRFDVSSSEPAVSSDRETPQEERKRPKPKPVESIFRYRLVEEPPAETPSEKTQEPIVEALAEEESTEPESLGPLFDGPLARPSEDGAPAEERTAVPQQRDLELGFLEEEPKAEEEDLGLEDNNPFATVLPERAVRISREVLFSRLLAGIIDVSVAVLLGLGFTAAGSTILKFDLFHPDSLVWVAVISLVFFLFSSLFFLLTCRQTMGMQLTDLRLVSDDDSEDLPVFAVALRVILFLPAAVSLVGLLWSLVDPFCRCVHDVLSGTKVEPSDYGGF